VINRNNQSQKASITEAMSTNISTDDNYELLTDQEYIYTGTADLEKQGFPDEYKNVLLHLTELDEITLNSWTSKYGSGTRANVVNSATEEILWQICSSSSSYGGNAVWLELYDVKNRKRFSCDYHEKK
jgi:hypothetical protein